MCYGVYVFASISAPAAEQTVNWQCTDLWSQMREDWAGCSPECYSGSHPTAATRSWGEECRRAAQDAACGAPHMDRIGCSLDWQTTKRRRDGRKTVSGLLIAHLLLILIFWLVGSLKQIKYFFFTGRWGTHLMLLQLIVWPSQCNCAHRTVQRFQDI